MRRAQQSFLKLAVEIESMEKNLPQALEDKTTLVDHVYAPMSNTVQNARK